MTMASPIATTPRSWSTRTGRWSGRYRKVHIPGHEHNEPWRPFQHAERHFFEPGKEFPVWRAFGGVVGMAICNDRRWPETYRVMGLQGAELILIGYNTPLYYAPDPQQNALQAFHNHLVMQSGAYQNGAYVVGVAKGGIEEGVDSLAQTVIIAPSGQIVAQAITTGDEVVVARLDLDYCDFYKKTVFDFARYRSPRGLPPDHGATETGRELGRTTPRTPKPRFGAGPCAPGGDRPRQNGIGTREVEEPKLDTL